MDNYHVVGDPSLAQEIGAEYSYVGMVILSTTLDSIEDVQAIYGSNTTWAAFADLTSGNLYAWERTV